MRKYLFTIILILSVNFLKGQACILTNQININTGFDPITNALVPLGSNDPRWIIDNANNIPGAVNNAFAVSCTPNGGAAANPNSSWIGFAQLSQYVTNNPTVGFYLMTYRFQFRTCFDDSLHFNFNIANDNYCSAMRIDGIPTGFSQPVGLQVTNWTTFTNFQISDFYLSGNHTIEIDVQNYNVAGAMNPHMLNIFGTLTSVNNSIVTFANPQNCVCNILSDTIIADYSFNFPNICDSTIIQFTDLSTAINSNVTTWSWDFGDGNTSNLQNPVHNYLNAGTYIVTLIATNNFLNSDTFTTNITVYNNSPTVSAIATPPVICAGASTVLNGAGAVTYIWSGGVTDGVAFTPLTTASYTVTGTDAIGCTNTSLVTVTVNALPLITANANPPVVCPGASTVLTGAGGMAYSWSGGISDGIAFIPAANATYTVTGADANGCTNTSTVSVSLSPGLSITVFPPDSTICNGDTLQLTASGASTYTWTNAGSLDTNAGPVVLAYPGSTTTYTVTGTDAGGCTGLAIATLHVLSGIDLTVTKNRDAECDINTVQLQVSGAQNYVWTPANLVSNAYAALTNALAVQTTTFYVTGNTGSCIDTDSITVYYYNNDETGIMVPNAFSPNGDGLNDCLRILHSANFTKYYFAIYNRWGEMVFETEDPSACWNGEHKNKPADVSTFYYFMKAETICGKIFKKGDISLIR